MNHTADVKIETLRQFAGKMKPLAYIAGVYLGDGWMGRLKKYNRWDFRLNTIDNDFAEATAKAMFELTGRKPKIHIYPVSKSSKPNHSITFGCKDLFFLIDATAYKTCIPDFVKKANREEKLEFVAGIMDSEGYVAKRQKDNALTLGLKATGNWMYEFQALMQSLGVQVGKIGKELLPSGKTAIRFHFNILSWIKSGCYFNISRKQNRINKWALNPQRLICRTSNKMKIESELHSDMQRLAEMPNPA